MCERFCDNPAPMPEEAEPSCLITQRWDDLCPEQRRALVPEIERLLRSVQTQIDQAQDFSQVEKDLWPERDRWNGYLAAIKG